MPEPSKPPASDLEGAEVVVSEKKGLPVIWIIPVVAVLIGGWLWIQALREKGPTITVTWETAAGLEAGKTKVKFLELEVGEVSSISFLDDLSGVEVEIEMAPGTKNYLTKDTRFWVVRPRIGAGGVSGLGTLVSGAYIGMDPGTAEGKLVKSYVGLELPPIHSEQEGGLKIMLTSDERGSIGIGTPIYYRQVEVGQVERTKLSGDGVRIVMNAHIEKEYSHLLTENCRFWNTSGISARMGADGIEVHTESLEALLQGGIAFGLAHGVDPGAPVEAGHTFQLFPSQEATTEVFEEEQHWVLFFEESVRGLSIGAPVEFRGLKVGEVAEIGVRVDPRTEIVYIVVVVETQPERIEVVGQREDISEEERHEGRIEAGLRARLETGSLLTGALFIDVDFFPDTELKLVGLDERYPEVPTIPSSSAEIRETIARLPEIVANIERATQSFADIMTAPETDAAIDSLRNTLAEAETLVASVNTEVKPLLDSLRQTSDDAQQVLLTADQTLGGVPEVQYRLDVALDELASGLRSLRALTDYLERHPDALIRGKGGE